MDLLLEKAKADIEKNGFLDIPLGDGLDLASAIRHLKEAKKAVILAHYYQRPEIQDIADYVGDSLGLSQQAEQTNAEIIVFAGVHFMAETAKILNPEKKVLLPDLHSGCSLAESCSPTAFEEFLRSHSGYTVVSYINCSAAVKAMSDIICTSSNAEKIINAIPPDKKIIFAPDKNLGRYLVKKTGRPMVLWNGSCIVHEAFSIERLLKLHRQYPAAKIIAHPESEEHILKVAHYVGSTTGMIHFVKTDPHQEFIVATEAGVLHQMKKEAPGKTLIPCPVNDNNTCACSECGFMRMNTLEKIYLCLAHELPQIHIDEQLQRKALLPIQRMLTISKN